MNFSRRFSSVLSVVRSLAIAVVFAVMLFINSSPALAIGSTPSSPSEGETQLDEILKESQDAIRPENALNADEVIKKANRGINEVQESADADKMSRPENSRQATSAAEQVQRALKK